MCFVAFVVFYHLERNADSAASKDAIIPLPAVEGTLAILGVASVLVNFIFALLILIYRIFRKEHTIAKWLVWVNLLFLLLQFIYFKLY